MKWEKEGDSFVSETPSGKKVIIFPDRKWWKFTVNLPSGAVKSGWWNSLEACKEGVQTWVKHFGPAHVLRTGELRTVLLGFQPQDVAQARRHAESIREVRQLYFFEEPA